MLYQFLDNNVDELVDRCAAKVAQRPHRRATELQLRNGIPMFLSQLIKTLKAEQENGAGAGLVISGASGGGDAAASSEMGVSAVAHGNALLSLGYTVDQVVHDYGDLCQAITDLAVERDAPFSVDEFRTLNRCLDNAIADAVTEFTFQRDATIALVQSADVNEKLGFLMHELRNSLSVAMLAVAAMEAGTLPIKGATGAILKRSHTAMQRLIAESLDEVRASGAGKGAAEIFSLAQFIEEASGAAQLDATERGIDFRVAPVDATLAIQGNRDLLLAALANLLNNAFKFTRAGSRVTLAANDGGERVYIEVRDQCGGLGIGDAEKMFSPFSQRGDDKTGLGLGLSIARQSIAADNGRLTVENLPNVGCIFRIDLPRLAL
ncbi:HAMP domain-containing histidine kinase [Massilia sp. PAMC28688]|uniref:sensor histidine kinase n=1 Tax=Massilia sp. PAMC28688 TaxID=2861283 RepID=UPI001C626178|nr:HAMP domain-containing sensor histidine kinase [Massilia sp. PAMC28688]QYF93236.1 HAMP domain-containing histidine kinase [Massilia sp. PAMC28688]